MISSDPIAFQMNCVFLLRFQHVAHTNPKLTLKIIEKQMSLIKLEFGINSFLFLNLNGKWINGNWRCVFIFRFRRGDESVQFGRG